MLALAEYHASTYHFVQTYPGGEAALLEDHKHLKPVTYFYFVPKFAEKSIDNMAQLLPQIGTIIKEAGYAELGAKVEQLVGTFSEMHKKAAVASDNCKFKTIIHGDFWYNNVMVK